MNSEPSDQQFLLNIVHNLDGLLPDPDDDGLYDGRDNCKLVANGPLGTGPSQNDADLDGYGNWCDGDFTQDGIVGSSDLAVLKKCLEGGAPANDPDCSESDLDGDGVVLAADFDRLAQLFGDPPGPSGLGCAGTIPCAGP